LAISKLFLRSEGDCPSICQGSRLSGFGFRYALQGIGATETVFESRCSFLSCDGDLPLSISPVSHESREQNE